MNPSQGQTPNSAKLLEVVRSIIDRGVDPTIEKFDLEVIRDLIDENAPVPDVPTQWSADYENLRQCSNVSEVQAAVRDARAGRKTIRIAGAQHSAPQAVFNRAAPNEIHVKLEGDLRKVEVLEENAAQGYLIVRAGAGANLGIDPSDPQSNAGNSFNRTVDALGYALPILGGMSHQTLGGYLSTSTAGGSLSFGFGDSLIGLELVDGLGNVRVLEQGSDDFYAAAVSMGLYGVVTHVKVKLVKRYLVKGHEEILATKDSILASGPTFQAALGASTYVHSVWFAHPDVDRVLQFRAEQAPESDPIVPYVHVLSSKRQNYFAALALTAANALDYSNSKIEQDIAAFIIKLMSPISVTPKYFCDHWYLALPNDDQALIDSVIRVQFTEIWLDLARTPDAYNALTALFAKDPLAGGNFGVELYCAKQSPFWMSQSYGRDVVRVDPYWWEYNPEGNLNSFFEKYWKALLPIPTARLHWGKHFPAVGTRYGDITIGPDYVEKSFPKFKDWRAKRAEFDPEQIFVTDYWRALLGIPSLK